MTVHAGGVPVVISPFLPHDAVHVIDGDIYAGSVSAVLAQIERERRRQDAFIAFAAGVNE
jgi:hypothetical protein